MCFKCLVRIRLNFKHDVSCFEVDLAQKAQWSHSSLQLKAADSLCYSVAPVRKELCMARISLQATSAYSLHFLFSAKWEGRENGIIHNSLIWKSRLISLSKGSNLPTENNVQLNAGKEISHFQLQQGKTYLKLLLYKDEKHDKTIIYIWSLMIMYLAVYSVRCHGSLCQPQSFPTRRWQ